MISVIKPLVDEVTQNVVSCEVDSSKIPAGEDIEQNMCNLLGLCQKFLDGMMGSVDSCPYAFRVSFNSIPRPLLVYANAFQEVMAHLQREVIQRFPTANFIAVAGFIFLRFFCPAISAPDAQDVVPTSQLNAQARRTLVLISKVIQCLANGTKFGQKETFMHPCNPFIEANQAACNNFLATLSVCKFSSGGLLLILFVRRQRSHNLLDIATNTSGTKVMFSGRSQGY